MKADKRILMFFALVFLFASALGKVYAESDEASCFEPILLSCEKSFLDLEELGFESVFPYDENIAIAFDDEMSDVSSLMAEEIVLAKGLENAEFVLNGIEGSDLLLIDKLDALDGETFRPIEIGEAKLSLEVVSAEEAFNGVDLIKLGFEEIDDGLSEFIELTRASTEEN